MVNVSALSFQYNSTATIRFPDIAVSKGEHFLLLGESGSGKTTLLHLIGGLLRQYKGSIKIDGTELSSLSESSLDLFRARKIGFIFQRNHLIQALNVEQNLGMAPYLAGLPADPKRVEEVLGILGLQEKKHSRIAELSYGQAQRVAIARAVLNKPTLLLADEPTSALDDRNCMRVIDLLIEQARNTGSTLIVATHDQRLKNKIHNKIDLDVLPQTPLL